MLMQKNNRKKNHKFTGNESEENTSHQSLSLVRFVVVSIDIRKILDGFIKMNAIWFSFSKYIKKINNKLTDFFLKIFINSESKGKNYDLSRVLWQSAVKRWKGNIDFSVF